MFVDFAGQTMEVVDAATGEVRKAEVFVAVLGASSYTYAEAVWTQGLPDWISAHVNALAFFDGVPRQIVCDNLRSGITRACVLRAAGEPNLRRHGAALRHRSDAGTAATKPVTRRRSKSASRWCNAGSGQAATSTGSSRWPS